MTKKGSPQYLFKEVSIEYVGEELATPIDELKSISCDLVLLGSLDTDRSRIPREFSRLEHFGELGGPHEVAFASGGAYFWADFAVGAWWTLAPFKRPVLFTNTPRLRLRHFMIPYDHLVLLAHFKTPEGKNLRLRDVLQSESNPYELASRGELQLVRNSPDELISAHKEMVARLDGTWREEGDIMKLRARVQETFSEFYTCQPIQFASRFLLQNEHWVK